LIKYFEHHKITEKCCDHHNVESSDFYSEVGWGKGWLFYFKFQEMKSNYFGPPNPAFFLRIMPLSTKYNVLNSRKSYVITQGKIFWGEYKITNLKLYLAKTHELF
jgi:hypothetical protein